MVLYISAAFKAEFCILTPFDITSLFESAFSRYRDFSESLRIMRERLLAGLKNPQLVYFQEDIELSKIAFTVLFNVPIGQRQHCSNEIPRRPYRNMQSKHNRVPIYSMFADSQTLLLHAALS
jgi:hypothetical protein